MIVRPMRPGEEAACRALRRALWPDCEEAMHAAELAAIAAAPDANAVLVADEEGRLVGFLEASLRDHADGCLTSPVGYIEGWYVAPAHRGRGIGAALVAAAERWARGRGCREMASDVELANEGGQRAHRALGYEETFRVVLFRKSIGDGGAR
jgi:aminoglycoside 6'-N-acetyltransferase I